MKIPYSPKCSRCHTTWTAKSSEDEPQTQCPKCRMPTFILDHDLKTKIFLRAQDELRQGDVSLTLILSAMAVECELARLFFKWKAIDADMSPYNIPEPRKSRWESEYRGFRSVSAKLDGVCKLMVGRGFDSYVFSDLAIEAAVRKQNRAYRSGTSSKQFFQERLFEKSNEIIHHGNTKLPIIDGVRGFAVAQTVLGILQAADQVRLKALEKRLGFKQR